MICRSESEYPEHPVALYWEGQRQEIDQIISRWRTPEGKHFLVATESYQLFKITYSEQQGHWQVSQP